MDATNVVIHRCWGAFYETYAHHFEARGITLDLGTDIIKQKKTRTYQYFQILVTMTTADGSDHAYGDFKVALSCYYNLEGALRLYIQLGKFDPFKGAADFKPPYAKFIYQVDDIIRSFGQGPQKECLAIIKV